MAALFEIDVRDILPTIRVPTLILHRRGDLSRPIEGARLMAEQIPDARLVEFEGDDHVPFTGNFEPIADEMEEFLTGTRKARAHGPGARHRAVHRHRRLDARAPPTPATGAGGSCSGATTS